MGDFAIPAKTSTPRNATAASIRASSRHEQLLAHSRDSLPAVVSRGKGIVQAARLREWVGNSPRVLAQRESIRAIFGSPVFPVESPQPPIQGVFSSEVGGVVDKWKSDVLTRLGEPLATELRKELETLEDKDKSAAIADPEVKKLLRDMPAERLSASLKTEDVATVTKAHSSLVAQIAKTRSDYSKEIEAEGSQLVLPAGTIVYRITDGITARGYLLNGIPVTNNKDNWKELGIGFYTGADMEGAKVYADTIKGLPVVLELSLGGDAQFLKVANTRKTDDKSGPELHEVINKWDGLTDPDASQFKFHPKFYRSALKIVKLHVKEGAAYKEYSPGDFVPTFEGYLSGKHKQEATKRKKERLAKLREDKKKPAFAPSEELLKAPDAPDWAIRYIQYQEAAEQFETNLGEFAATHKGAGQEVAKLVHALWKLFPGEKERAEFGTRQTNVTGMVGTDLSFIEQVVKSGNLREHLAFLYNGYTSRLFEGKFGREAFERPTSLEDERAQRRELDIAVKATPANPHDVQPPLSEREWFSAVDKEGRLGWHPGQHLHEMKTYYDPDENLSKTDKPTFVPAPFEQLAEITGALTKTGTSGTAYGMFQVAEQVSKATGESVDLPLYRLALIGGMVPAGDHSFHEIMLASQMFGSGLTYDNSHRRYRTIAPLSESELRGLAPSRKFPDELLEPDDISER